MSVVRVDNALLAGAFIIAVLGVAVGVSSGSRRAYTFMFWCIVVGSAMLLWVLFAEGVIHLG